MKPIFAAVIWFPLLASTLTGQGDDQQAMLRQRLEKKRSEAWLQKTSWVLDYDKARRLAKAQGKPIFGYFTRSYAGCSWCVRCEQGPLSDPGFAAFAAKVVPFCHITSRVDGEKYPNLMRAVGGRGFPTLVFLDADGKVLKEQKGLEERSVAAFERTLGAIEDLRRSEVRAAKGDATAKIDVVLARIALGQILNHEVAKGRLADAGDPTPEQQERIQAAVANLEVAYVLRRRRRDVQEVGSRFARMLADGRIPTNEHARFFWRTLEGFAKVQRDDDLAARAAKALAALEPAPAKQR